MKRTLRHIVLMVVAILMTTSCTDDLFGGIFGGKDDGDGMTFSIGVEEQADVIYRTGGSRAADGKPDPAIVEANTFKNLRLSGGIANLNIHRMPLPIIGIHPHTAGSVGESVSRAALSEIAGNGIAFHDSLTIWGYTSQGRQLFNKNLLRKVNGWRSSVHWPYDKEDVDAAYLNPTAMKFYAVSPAMENLEDLSLKNTPAYATQPQFTFSVPDAPGVQRDLLYGESTPTTASAAWGNVDIQDGPTGSYSTDPKEENLGLDNKNVKLKFFHTLTAIRFAQGKMPVGAVVKSIELQGVYKKGDYTPGSNAVGSWTNQATYNQKQNYTIAASTTVATYNPGSNVYIDDGNVLFLMPQTVPTGAKLVVTVNVGGSDRTMSVGINGDTWNPGYTVTYKVTVGEVKDDYYLVIDSSANYETSGSVTTPVDGNTSTETKYSHASDAYEHSISEVRSITVHSFRNYKNYSANASGVNTHHAVNWKIAGFATDEAGPYGTTDDAFSTITGWNLSSHEPSAVAGATTTLSYNINSPIDHTANHATILQTNTPIEVTMDLSVTQPDGTVGGTAVLKRTANSYIVNAQGSYKIPMVYGNGYEGGTKKTGAELNPGDIFKDHAGRTITAAHIFDQVNYQTVENVTPTTEDKTAAGDDEVNKTVVTTTYTYNHSASDYTAEVVWQDATGVFNEVGIVGTPEVNGDAGYIGFTVSPSATPSNCVIALKGKKTTTVKREVYNGETLKKTIDGTPSTAGDFEILWTWHIWVTDEVYPNSGSSVPDSYYYQYNPSTGSKIVTLYDNSGNATGRILPVNLGWVPDNVTWHKYEPREVWVKIVQDDANSTQAAYVKLRREANPELITGTSTVYQWGRPTALPMIIKAKDSDGIKDDSAFDGEKNTVRTLYNNAGNAIATVDLTTVPTISNVQDFLLYPSQMVDGIDFQNYWGYNNSTGLVTKTLYDPCPPGFKMAVTTDYSVFNHATGGATSPLNSWNTLWSKNNVGSYLYTKAHSSGAVIPESDRYGTITYLPSSGKWSINTANRNFGNASYSFLWGADYSGTKGMYLQLKSGEIDFSKNENIKIALPVRPKAQ
ncbi:MAG: hypothetical protein IJV13_06690 [Prevotella sp.]|nr:hypothetical protein [Prevotella sp.]